MMGITQGNSVVPLNIQNNFHKQEECEPIKNKYRCSKGQLGKKEYVMQADQALSYWKLLSDWANKEAMKECPVRSAIVFVIDAAKVSFHS